MSVKSLANLVCESSVRTSEKVLHKELVRSLPDLLKGILAYGPNTTEKPPQFVGTSEKKIGSFLIELAQFLNVEDDKAKLILSNYLAGDFRGTPDSLKKLASEDRFRKPLLRDIWHFYRAERLYILEVLKAIFSNARNANHNHSDIFGDIFFRLVEENTLKDSLIKQLQSALNEEPPTRETHGKSFSDEMASSWVHTNLREIAEILQLIILYSYNMEGVEEENLTTPEEFLDLVKLFQSHGFSRKTVSQTKQVEVDCELIEAIGIFQSLLIVLLMDLPRLSCEVSNPVMKSSVEIDRVIAGLGNKADHGPVMLAWMLAHFLVGDDLVRYRALGESSVHLKVLKTFNNSLTNTVVCANDSISAVIHSTVFAVVSVLVSAFDPSKMDMDKDLQVLLCTLFKDKNVAATFWKTSESSEIGLIFASKLRVFPSDLSDSLEMLEALAKASPSSGDEVFNRLENLQIFAEHIQSIPHLALKQLGPNQMETVSSKQIASVQIPNGTKVIYDGKLYLFHLRYSGIKCFLAEIEKLTKQASQGAAHLSQLTLSNVTGIVRLFEVLLRNSGNCFQTWSHQISKACLHLVERIVRLPTPHVKMLSSCIQSLATVARQKPYSIWERLAETGIFPYQTCGLGSTDDSNINPGFVGGLLAQYECVQGLYPLTMSFLDLLLTCVTLETADLVRPSIIYVIQDIFPSYRQWRFEISKEREIFGQKILRVIKRVIMMNKSEELQKIGINALLSPAPNHTLLAIASTGDKYIQSLYQSQSSMEGGLGFELSRCVHLSLTILNNLLQKTGIENITSLKKVICSPPTGSRQHFLLTVAHYLYHSRSFDLPLAAVNLLSTVATILPMSLLACLGSDAEAIRDILIHRLEAQTVDVLLKIGIIRLFSACVGSQPGFIQLLIGAKNSSNDYGTKLPEEKSGFYDNDVVDCRGCLSTVSELLSEVTEKSDTSNYELHLTLVEFIYSLCENQRIVALAYLKKQDKFWEKLTKPLMLSSTSSKPKLLGCVLRILSSEVYTYKGEIDNELKAIFEKLFDENSSRMSEWCKDKLFKTSSQTMEIDDTFLTSDEKEDDNKADVPFLLSSWKSFLLVVAHDHPISVSPKLCNKIVTSLMIAIRDHISLPLPDLEVTTAFSETCLVLVQKWQTKCAEKMDLYINDQCLLLNELSLAFDQLNSRTRCSIIGIASISLRFSSFMMDHEEEILYLWLRPLVILVEKYHLLFTKNITNEENTPLIISLCLLHNLLSRFKNPQKWLNILHERSTIQALIGAVHFSVRSRKHEEVAVHCLGLLVLIAQTDLGTDAMLSGCDLSQMLWLPISYLEITNIKEKWRTVFLMSVHLSSTIQKNGKHRSLESSVSVITLLQNHLTSTLLSLRETIQCGKLDLIVSSAFLVTDLMSYHKQLQLQNRSTLVHFYRIICGVVHQSICLLLRPSYLSILINQKEKQSTDFAEGSFSRRRLSSNTDIHDGVGETPTPELTLVQNQLLEIVSFGLSMLLSMSPDLFSLVTDDISDCASFYQLLQVGFAIPGFEQDESGGLSYGTVISISNHCTRSLTKFTESPSSPSRGNVSSQKSEPVCTDRRRTIIVLEKSLALVLSQSLLFLSDPKYSPREKQLLKRELGAELESVVESMRRHTHRGTKSPHPDSNTFTTGRFARIDEKFMKFVTAIVQKAFK